MSPAMRATVPRSPTVNATMRSSPFRRCTRRLSSSMRCAVSRSPRTIESAPIIVCAFARVLGEPEPSASSSRRRSRASCSWLRISQKRQSAEPILRPTSASPASTAQVSAARMLSRSCVETLEPLALLRALQAQLGFFGEHEVEAGVSTPDGLAVTAVRQTLDRVRADGLEHPQARLVSACRLGSEQVLLEERLDALQDVEPVAARRRPRRRSA